MKIRNRHIFPGKMMNRLLSLFLMISFSLHLLVFHPMNRSLVVCKTESSVNIETSSIAGICDHQNTLQSEKDLSNIKKRTCEDTSLFNHYHDYDHFKNRVNPATPPVTTVITQFFQSLINSDYKHLVNPSGTNTPTQQVSSSITLLN